MILYLKTLYKFYIIISNFEDITFYLHKKTKQKNLYQCIPTCFSGFLNLSKWCTQLRWITPCVWRLMTREVLHRLNSQERINKYSSHIVSHIHHTHQSCVFMWVTFQWRTTASQSSDSNHRTPLTGSQNLLPASALYRDWHTHPALLRRQHRQQRTTVHLSHQQLRHTDKTHKNNWETPTEANFLFAQFLPQKQSHCTAAWFNVLVTGN